MKVSRGWGSGPRPVTEIIVTREVAIALLVGVVIGLMVGRALGREAERERLIRLGLLSPPREESGDE